MLTVILDNFFGRQFNSLNDASINPRNGEIYFTDPTYGYVQDFRPPPGLPKQVWRFNEATGAVAVAADGFNMPNGKRNRETMTQNPVILSARRHFFLTQRRPPLRCRYGNVPGLFREQPFLSFDHASVPPVPRQRFRL